jgi:acetyltransferase-like isoleucine patch superfamily enzyme
MGNRGLVRTMAAARASMAPLARPVRRRLAVVGRWRRRARYLRDGIEGIAMELRGAIDCVPILREYGASVGERTTIMGPLHIMNADRDFSNLRIGDDVYIGTDVLFDIADRVVIGDAVSIGMRSSLVTSFDVGPGPLRARRPPKRGPIVIEDGAYLGTGVTVLHSVTVGREATLGAHALIRRDVPAGATYLSPLATPFVRPGD